MDKRWPKKLSSLREFSLLVIFLHFTHYEAVGKIQSQERLVFTRAVSFLQGENMIRRLPFYSPQTTPSNSSRSASSSIYFPPSSPSRPGSKTTVTSTSSSSNSNSNNQPYMQNQTFISSTTKSSNGFYPGSGNRNVNNNQPNNRNPPYGKPGGNYQGKFGGGNSNSNSQGSNNYDPWSSSSSSSASSSSPNRGGTATTNNNHNNNYGGSSSKTTGGRFPSSDSTAISFDDDDNKDEMQDQYGGNNHMESSYPRNTSSSSSSFPSQNQRPTRPNDDYSSTNGHKYNPPNGQIPTSNADEMTTMPSTSSSSEEEEEGTASESDSENNGEVTATASAQQTCTSTNAQNERLNFEYSWKIQGFFDYADDTEKYKMDPFAFRLEDLKLMPDTFSGSWYISLTQETSTNSGSMYAGSALWFLNVTYHTDDDTKIFIEVELESKVGTKTHSYWPMTANHSTTHTHSDSNASSTLSSLSGQNHSKGILHTYEIGWEDIKYNKYGDLIIPTATRGMTSTKSSTNMSDLELVFSFEAVILHKLVNSSKC